MAHSQSWHESVEVSVQLWQGLRAVGPALAAALLGLLLIYGAGFTQPQAIHDAAHDARHGLGLPCH